MFFFLKLLFNSFIISLKFLVILFSSPLIYELTGSILICLIFLSFKSTLFENGFCLFFFPFIILVKQCANSCKIVKKIQAKHSNFIVLELEYIPFKYLALIIISPVYIVNPHIFLGNSAK